MWPWATGGGPDGTTGAHFLRLPASEEFRAGGRVLSLFAAPLNSLILRALAEESLTLGELRDRTGRPALTTLRARLNDLVEIGAVTKIERRAMPHSVAHALTAPGDELLFVTDVLETWFDRSPNGKLEWDTESAKGAVRGLSGGWSTSILRALAIEARTLTELDKIIEGVSYHTIERRLGTMRTGGQVKTLPAEGQRGKPYVLTNWLRRGIGPLAAAGRWERRHLAEETEPVTWVEVEASFLLTLAIVELPPETSGECVLAVDTKEEERRIAGVHVKVEKGQIAYASPRLQRAPTFALGTATQWMDAVIDNTAEEFHIKGDDKLVATLVEGLHSTLYRR